MVLVGKAHLARDDKVKLLALVAGQMHRHVLLLLQVRCGDHEGLGQLVAEVRRLVQVFKASAALDGQALIRTGKRIACQVRILACEQLDHVDAELIGAFVQEGKGEILLARLLGGILGGGTTGSLGHLLQGEVHILSQRANTPRHLFDIRLHDCDLLFLETVFGIAVLY